MQEVVWRPNPGPQTAFLRSTAKEVLYGGAAGGGKSDALLACPLRWISNPNYRGLYLRREASYLGQAIDRSRQIYPALGGRLVMSPTVRWTFPSGAMLWMNHCAAESDISNYDSFEFAEVLFDELTHFTLKQYVGIRARLRGTDRTLPYWSRSGSNPGNEGHEWVKERWRAWLCGSVESREKPGAKRWYTTTDHTESDAISGTPYAVSRTFIPALIADNPYIDDEYRAGLRQLDPVRRAQLELGDWDACAGEGKLFNRTWWVYLDEAPTVLRKARGWDFGAGGDPTEGVLLGDRGEKGKDGLPIVPRWVVLDCVSHVGPPHEVHKLVKDTADADGQVVTVRLPQDPGQAGKDQAQTFTRELAPHRVVTKPVTGDKVVRAGGFSSQVGARNVGIVRAPWTPAFVAQHHAFPDIARDDKVDAAADAFDELTGNQSWSTRWGFLADDARFPGID